ncbi:MAG: thioredoxin [Turicibacter sp.]|nr:thioredoxin [Turicibacter sp.]
MNNIVEIKYNAQLPQITQSGLTLVDFYATWCGPCQQLAPVFETLFKEYQTQIQFVKVNVDDTPVLANEYHVMTVPTLMLFKDGKPIESAKGFHPLNELKSWLNYHLK